MAPPNKFLDILKQGIAGFIYTRDENNTPFLGDNPLFLAPWGEDIEEYIKSKHPQLASLIGQAQCRRILNDPSGGITFSSIEQATDFYHDKLRTDYTFCNPAPVPYMFEAEALQSKLSTGLMARRHHPRRA